MKDVAPPGWDALTVEVPGGHVLQSTVSAAHAVEDGWRPRFVTFTDGAGALVLTRRRAPLPGFLAYASRGPVAGEGGAQAAAARALALGRWARRAGATILAVDPELDADPSFEATLAAGGFVPAEEIQPSRHRLVVSWASGTDEAALFAGLSKTTRQRVRQRAAPGGDGAGGRGRRPLARSGPLPGRHGRPQGLHLLLATRLPDLVATPARRPGWAGCSWPRPGTGSLAACSCTARAATSRPPSRPTIPPPARRSPGRCSCCAGMPCAWPSRAGCRAWTWAGWTSPGHGAGPSRATRRGGCTSTRSASARTGSNRRGHTSWSSARPSTARGLVARSARRALRRR